MDADTATRFLHDRIPVTGAMGFTVTALATGRVAITAPLALNPNPHGTLFGGTLATLGLVSCWTLLHAAMEEAGVHGQLVGAKSESTFVAAGTQDCTALAECAAAPLQAFLDSCRQGRRARIEVSSTLTCGATLVARHQGVFVALPTPDSEDR